MVMVMVMVTHKKFQRCDKINFKKETIKLLKIDEEQMVKKEIDYLKIKTSDHQHKINLLKDENEYLQMEVQNLKFTSTMSQIYIFTVSTILFSSSFVSSNCFFSSSN